MKRLLFILIPVLLLCFCGKESAVQLVKFTDSGCSQAQMSPDTRAGGGQPSQLILKHSSEGLVITRTNALMNCSIKNDGMGCEVSIEGNTIHLKVYEKGEKLRCVCPVETMSSTVSGLSTGNAYILDYTCDGTYSPISFTYEEGMKMVIDLDLYKPSASQ